MPHIIDLAMSACELWYYEDNCDGTLGRKNVVVTQARDIGRTEEDRTRFFLQASTRAHPNTVWTMLELVDIGVANY